MRKEKAPRQFHLLEQTNLDLIKDSKKRTERFLDYHWKYYSELVHQRTKHQDKIQNALGVKASRNFSFSNWQRGVKYKYGLHPLCVLGSLNDPGGRFNIGDINPNIPKFPALYLAEDKDTVLQELLCQNPTKNPNPSLSSQELALTSNDSISILSICGQLDSVFDTRISSNLKPFLQIIKKFKLPENLFNLDQSIGEKPPEIINTITKLKTTINHPDWRSWPTLFDIPAAPQIFGQLVFQAGIEGILYKSKFTRKDCLCIFPGNFKCSDSFLELEDETPPTKAPKRIDSTNFDLTLREYKGL